MTMTDSTGNYRMNQLLYLVSDGEDGYLITATFPEDGEPDLKPVSYTHLMIEPMLCR